MYKKEEIEKFIQIKSDNFIVLPNAFNQERRNYGSIYDFSVQRLIMNSSFHEKCQDLGLQIINQIRGSTQNISKRFDQFMKIAGDSFRTITSFPDLLRFKNLNEVVTNKTLRQKVDELLQTEDKIHQEYKAINDKIINEIHSIDLAQLKTTPDFIVQISMPLQDKFNEYSNDIMRKFKRFASAKEFADYTDIIKNNERILVN